MKKSWIIIIILIIVLSAVIVPIIINESYKSIQSNIDSKGYLTLWKPNDVLLYFGSVLSAMGTIMIGFIAFKQNDRSNEINDRLLKLQEINSVPFIHIDSKACEIQSFGLLDVDILMGFRNETNSVINIVKVSDLKIDPGYSNEIEIPFCKGWTKYYSILPHQTVGINYMKSIKGNKEYEKAITSKQIINGFSQIICQFNLKLQYANSTDIYEQKVELYIHIFEKEKKKLYLNISNIENQINKV